MWLKKRGGNASLKHNFLFPSWSSIFSLALLLSIEEEPHTPSWQLPSFELRMDRPSTSSFFLTLSTNLTLLTLSVPFLVDNKASPVLLIVLCISIPSLLVRTKLHLCCWLPWSPSSASSSTIDGISFSITFSSPSASCPPLQSVRPMYSIVTSSCCLFAASPSASSCYCCCCWMVILAIFAGRLLPALLSS